MLILHLIRPTSSSSSRITWSVKLPDKYIKMISSVKVYIKKYVKASGVYEIDLPDSIGIEMSDVKFKALKLKKGN